MTSSKRFKNNHPSKQHDNALLYLINIHWPSVDFDWSRAGHAEGAILSCRMIILPSDVTSTLKSAGALVVTCFCLQCTWRVLFCHVASSYYLLTSYPPKCVARVVACVCHVACRYIVSKVVWHNKKIVVPE